MNSKNEQANVLAYNFIYNMKFNERKEKQLNDKMNQQIDLLNFICNMRLKEGKEKKQMNDKMIQQML